MFRLQPETLWIIMITGEASGSPRLKLPKGELPMDAQELFKKSLMTYDTKYGTNDSFYYNLPYVKDFDLCNWRPMRMFSGNIIKFYQYTLDKPVILFTDTDE